MNFNPVSPNLVKARYVAFVPWLLIALIAAVVAATWFYTWLWAVSAVVFAALVWALWLIPMQVRNMGWLETPDELVLAKGKLWHTITVVPYGRIQFVDVVAGPIDRMFGLKSVELHTASSTSDSRISGLPRDIADQLRDRLAAQARERMSGL